MLTDCGGCGLDCGESVFVCGRSDLDRGGSFGIGLAFSFCGFSFCGSTFCGSTFCEVEFLRGDLEGVGSADVSIATSANGCCGLVLHTVGH